MDGFGAEIFNLGNENNGTFAQLIFWIDDFGYRWFVLKNAIDLDELFENDKYKCICIYICIQYSALLNTLPDFSSKHRSYR